MNYEITTSLFLLTLLKAGGRGQEMGPHNLKGDRFQFCPPAAGKGGGLLLQEKTLRAIYLAWKVVQSACPWCIPTLILDAEHSNELLCEQLSTLQAPTPPVISATPPFLEA